MHAERATTWRFIRFRVSLIFAHSIVPPKWAARRVIRTFMPERAHRMQPVADRKSFQFTLRRLFAVLTGIAVVCSFIYYCNSAREVARCTDCLNQLKQIGLALTSYESTYGRFPPPYVTDAQGKPLYSWRVLILPYLEEQRLHAQWRMDEPWDSPHNQSLPEPYSYKCPTARRNRQPGSPPYTDFLAVVGPGMAWEEGKRLSLADFVDAQGNTVMVVEVRGSQIHWAEPVDFDGTASLKINARPGLSIGSHHSGGANVLFANGWTVHLPDTTSEEEIKALLTRDGGENEAWREDGRINDDYWFGDLRWTGESWEGIYECVDKELPFSIDLDVVDPTDEQKGLALVAARKVGRHRSSRRLYLDAPWEEKARLDAAKEVIEATHSKSDDTPTDEDVQELADDMTLESWGITYTTEDAAVFPYLVYTSPKCLPNRKIRVRFSTYPYIGITGERMVIEAIDEVTVISE